MRTELQYLPAELILQILEEYVSRGSLTLLALCSRQWNDIVTPILYRRVDFDKRVHCNPGDYAPRKPYLKALTILFLSKPEVAAHVRHFSIRPTFGWQIDWQRDEQPDNYREWNYLLLRKFRAEIRQATCKSKWRAAWLKQADSDDSSLALLLPTLKNLETLDLMAPCQPHFTEWMFRRFGLEAQRGKAFLKLKSMFWTHEPEGYRRTFTVLCPGIFALPSIERIYLHFVTCDSCDEEWGHLKLDQISPRTSTCSYLEMRDCYFRSTILAKLFLITKDCANLCFRLGSPTETRACSR